MELHEERESRMLDLWLACWTSDEIATEVGLTRQAVDAVLQKTADLPEVAKHADFDTPHENGDGPP